MDKKRIVIVEDHASLREALRRFLSSNSDYEVVGAARDGLEAIEIVKNLRPELVLMDLSMPKMGGLPAIKEIKKQFPETTILVLTVLMIEEYAFATMKAGARGYVLKDTAWDELLPALDSVSSGKRYLSPAVSKQANGRYAEGKTAAPG